jgi:class 3 adenylate cyclase/tetratricopeptide (TPR) repeat protein
VSGVPEDFTSRLLCYVPMDRRQSLASGLPLPARATGAALFADISGFTSLADTLIRSLGPHEGAEELIGALNRVYEALVAEVDRYGGSVTGFAGDGFMAWFEAAHGGDLKAAALRAIACGLAMQNAMNTFHALWIRRRGGSAALGLKVAVEAGEALRFLAGEPVIQVIEVLAGPSVARLGRAAQVARDGEVLLGPNGISLVGEQVPTGERRLFPDSGEWFVPVNGLPAPVEPAPWPPGLHGVLSPEQVRPWVLPAVAQRLESDQGGFLTELRFTVSLFLSFGELDYASDPQAAMRLDAYVRWVQATLHRSEGCLLGVIVGDKGNYLYATFGAPLAHGDDVVRAAAAGLELLSTPPEFPFAGRPRIGIAAGQSRAGSVGGSTRSYAVMGDATNLAARLMQAAESGQILMSAALAPALLRRFQLRPVRPVAVKGKTDPVPAVVLLRRRPAAALRRDESQAAFSFVGRDEELAQVEQEIDQVLRGEGRTLGIAGPPGIGKSRFVSEVIQRAADEGMECLVGEAESTETQTPYLAWHSILRALFGVDARMRVEERVAALERSLRELDPELVARLPLLAAPLGLDLPDNALTAQVEPRLRKESSEDLLVQCLRRHAGRAPMLVALEDAHWLDPLSLDLAAAVSRAVPVISLLLLMTYRLPDTAQAAGSPIANLRNASEIRLQEFSEVEAKLLIRERLQLAFGPQANISSDFVDAVIERAGGNPFYLEELIKFLHHRAISPANCEAFRNLELPDSVATLILARIDRLSAQQQMTLRVASVIGREFRVDWLRAAHPEIGTDEQIHRHLDVLARLDLTPLNLEHPYRTYVFKHAIIQEVAYQNVSFALRSQLHEQFANWLEKREGEHSSPDLLAYHYGRDRDRAKQREYFEKAGRAAAGRYANAAAVHYFERWLQLLEPIDEPPALIALAEVLVRTGEWKAAEARYLRAIDLANRQHNRRLAAQAQLGFGKLQRAQGDHAAAAASLEKARDEFLALGDFAGSFDTSTELAFATMVLGDRQKAKGLIEESLRRAEQEMDFPRIARAQHLMGNITFAIGIAAGKEDFAAARPWWVRSVELQETLGNKFAVGELSSNLAVAALADGELEHAEALIRKVLVLFQEIGSRRQFSHAHMTLALVLLEKGDLRAARSSLVASLVVSSELEALQEIGDGLIVMSMIACRSGASPATARYLLRLYGSASKLKERGGDRFFWLRKRVEKAITEARRILGEEDADACVTAGGTMTWREAVEYAVSFGGREG